MENLLLKYMVARFNEEHPPSPPIGLPFITISRTHGCNARKVADCLMNEIRAHRSSDPASKEWQLISKEILAESATKLEVDEARVLKIFRETKRGAVDEILSSMSTRYYKSDVAVMNTVTKVIRDLAAKGNVVIIGRGGAAATGDLNGGIHVQLTAPLEWRISNVMAKGNFRTGAEAKEHILQTDKNREAVREKISGKKSGVVQFHVSYNCSMLTPEKIARSLLNLLIINNSM